MHLSALFFTHRLSSFLVFAGASLVFAVSQGLFFQGFNGVDDLHYAFLAHRMLQGGFSPFILNDLFAGRALLVAVQAATYAVGGVSIFTTQAASFAAVILSGYLTIFRLLQAPTPRVVLLASALFYFNPVLAGITLGPSPDVFILLAGVMLLLFLKRLNSSSAAKAVALTGLAAGIFIFSTLLIKESGLVFFPFAFLYGLFFLKEKRLLFLTVLTGSFLTAIAICGWVYYHYTGDFFFRVKQLQVAAYPNPCSYHSFFQKEMLVRLTYGVWEEFLRQNFLPVLLAMVVIVQGIFSPEEKALSRWDKKVFLLLLLVALYFPFSVSGYQPLCFKARHFLFLLPLAVVISSRWLEVGYARPKTNWYRNIIAAILIGWSIKISNNGWNWDFYRCLLLFLFLFPFSISKKLAAVTPLLLAAILWLSLPYRFIYERKNWFEPLQQLSTHLEGHYFYFPDHDNLMHWKLFHRFDTATHYFNLDPKPFLITNPYYESLQFHPGWLVVNRQYTIRTSAYFAYIDSLQQQHFFDSTIQRGPVSAYRLSNTVQLDVLQQGMAQEKRRECNCEQPAR